MDTKYNGWTNYETWRVHLELFDGAQFDYKVSAEECKEQIEQYLEDMAGENQDLVLSYAMAFINPVNWHEIAQHVNEYMEECKVQQ